MHIFIPTMGRTDDQRTLKALAIAGIEATLVMPWRERDQYAALGAKTLPVTAKGIASTRQAIIDHAKQRGETKLVMMDDDLSFAVRRKDDPTKFLAATPADVKRMLRTIEKHLDRVAHVSVLAREGGHNAPSPYIDNSRPQRIHGFNVPKLVEAGVRYNPGLVQDDFDMTLQLLRKGYRNRVITEYVHGQGTSNAPGGASSYRTIDFHNASVRKLAKIHAPYVRVVEKQTKGAWGGLPRLDCVISWKKAFAEGAGG